MNASFQSAALVPSLLFVLTLAAGFWLSHKGRPYSTGLFNLHKLIALAGVVLVILRLWPLRAALLTDLAAALLLALAAVCVLALFVSGALMSAGKLRYRLSLTAHRIAPALLVLAAVIFLFAG